MIFRKGKERKRTIRSKHLMSKLLPCCASEQKCHPTGGGYFDMTPLAFIHSTDIGLIYNYANYRFGGTHCKLPILL